MALKCSNCGGTDRFVRIVTGEQVVDDTFDVVEDRTVTQRTYCDNCGSFDLRPTAQSVED